MGLRLAAVTLTALAAAAFAQTPSPRQVQPSYRWLARYDPGQDLARRIPPPPGFARVPVEAGSLAEWLRHLPLEPGRPRVLLYDGRAKARQDVHEAVVDLDVGTRDLQQCADAVIRLRAEYLYSLGRHDAIVVQVTSGVAASYARWVEGFRPFVRADRLEWARTANRDASRAGFRRFLDAVFTYAGSISLRRETRPVDPRDLAAGDVFVQAGSPGHAVLVVDVARDASTGGKAFLLAQSYMPAQQVHVLRNPAGGGPWYDAAFGATLVTPEWTFGRDDLRRFPDGGAIRR